MKVLYSPAFLINGPLREVASDGVGRRAARPRAVVHVFVVVIADDLAWLSVSSVARHDWEGVSLAPPACTRRPNVNDRRSQIKKITGFRWQ